MNSNYYDCSDLKHCSNPCKDCINCPLRGGGNNGDLTYTSSLSSDYESILPQK